MLPRLLIALALTVLLCGPRILSSAPDEGAKQELVMGVFPRRAPSETRALFSPLATYLSEQLGRPVRVETGYDFASFWKGVEERRYDLVHYNQYHYVRSHKELGYRVILKNEEFGRDTIAGAIIARKDSDINDLTDLKGKKVVFGGGRTAMQSYILARHLLNAAGLADGDYFAQFAFTPPKACLALYYRQAAAAGTGDGVFLLPAVNNAMDTSEMFVVASTEPLAHLPWAVAPDLDGALEQRIQSLMMNLEQSGQGRQILRSMKISGLNVATDADFDRHREIILSVLGEAY